MRTNYRFDTEKSEQALVRNIVQAEMIVFDVGSNIGDYSILFSELVGKSGKVYAFEPTSSTFNRLNERIGRYQCKNVNLFQIAIFSQDGEIQINEFPEDYSAWNSVGKPKMLDPQQNYERYVEIVKFEMVESLTLDSFCKKNEIEEIDYLKVDVEGAEKHVLLGAINLLREQKVRFVQFEISENMLKGLETKAKDVFDILVSNGYECHRIEADGRIGEKVFNSTSFYENYIAFPSLVHPFSDMFDGLRSDLQQTQSELQQTQSELQQTQSELQQTQVKYQNLTQLAQERLIEINRMKGSKSWKAHKVWVKLKQLLGFKIS